MITNIQTELVTNDTDEIDLWEDSNNYHIQVTVNWLESNDTNDMTDFMSTS